MRMLISGDIHGAEYQVEYLTRVAKDEDCSSIFCIGDFGYWPHIDPEYLRNTEKLLSDADIKLYWIDGNHENFDMLFDAGQRGIDAVLYPHIVHIPRGTVWEWSGVRFLGMGGAISIDKDSRVLGRSYWAQEALTEEDINKGIEAAQNGSQELTEAYEKNIQSNLDELENEGEANFEFKQPSLVDVLLCHDAPSYVDVPLEGGLNDFVSKYKSLHVETQINRKYLSDLVEAVRPKQIYHGHYHVRHSNPYSRPGLTIPCEGLNCDGSVEQSWIVFDTEDWNA